MKNSSYTRLLSGLFQTPSNREHTWLLSGLVQTLSYREPRWPSSGLFQTPSHRKHTWTPSGLSQTASYRKHTWPPSGIVQTNSYKALLATHLSCSQSMFSLFPLPIDIMTFRLVVYLGDSTLRSIIQVSCPARTILYGIQEAPLTMAEICSLHQSIPTLTWFNL